jgi:hypothetical protein
VKDTIVHHVKILESSSKLILWFAVNFDQETYNDKLTCGVTYIPPIRSKYAHPDPYLEIQSEISELNATKLLLFGDFN